MNKNMEFFHNGKNLLFYYDDEHFKFTTDNISLANFVEIRKKDKLLVEFGSGLLAIPLLLSTSSNIKMVGIEKDSKACFLANKSIEKNNLRDRLTVINDDIKNINKYFKINSIDIIVCNPPYFCLENEAVVSKKETFKMARHEGDMTIQEMAYLSKVYLRDGGCLFLIQRVDRLFEIRDVLLKNKLIIQKVQFVHHSLNNNAKLVLIEARKNGKEQGLKVLKPVLLDKKERC